MDINFHFLAPVQVVNVTKDNLKEVAEWCGGTVLETPSRNPERQKKGQMDSYVRVPTPADAKVSWAFPGMFVTKRIVITQKNELRVTYAVFRREYFYKNYWDSIEAAVDATWERQARESERKKKSKRRPEVKVETNIGEELKAALARIEELEKKVDEPKEIELTQVPAPPAGNHVHTPGVTPIVMKGKLKTVTRKELTEMPQEEFEAIRQNGLQPAEDEPDTELPFTPKLEEHLTEAGVLKDETEKTG